LLFFSIQKTINFPCFQGLVQIEHGWHGSDGLHWYSRIRDISYDLSLNWWWM